MRGTPPACSLLAPRRPPVQGLGGSGRAPCPRGSQAGWSRGAPHPEPGSLLLIQPRGGGPGALQTRDGRGTVAEREAEAERAQGSGEGGEEDAAAAGSAARTGPRVSGAAGPGGRARPRPGPTPPAAHLPPRDPSSGWVSLSSGVMSPTVNACLGPTRTDARTAAAVPRGPPHGASHGRADQWVAGGGVGAGSVPPARVRTANGRARRE